MCRRKSKVAKFVELEEEDGISPWLGTAIPEDASPPGLVLAAVPVVLGTMVLATSPVVFAGTYFSCQ